MKIQVLLKVDFVAIYIIYMDNLNIVSAMVSASIDCNISVNSTAKYLENIVTFNVIMILHRLTITHLTIIFLAFSNLPKFKPIYN